MAGLTAQPLGAPEEFNWVFLVELLVCGILSVFFLFYFNRLFATVVSYAIRAYTWHAYRAYIDISALQISLLGGRVFFKSIRYHAHNVTVLVHDGHITWRYWLRLVQEAEIFDIQETGYEDDDNEKGSHDDSASKATPSEKSPSRKRSLSKAERGGNSGGKKELPCRISVRVSAVEAFIYNRSPVYDDIIKAARRKAQGAEHGDGDMSSEKQNPLSSSDQDEDHNAPFHPAEKTETISSHPLTTGDNSDKPALPFFLRILPVKIECKRAAAVLGNEHTTSIITAKVEKAAGTIDAGQAGYLDIFKLLFNFDLEQVNVAMKPNRDFKQHQLDAAQRILREKELDPAKPKQRRSRVMHKLVIRWNKWKKLFRRKNSSVGSLRTASMESVAGDDVAIGQDPLPGEAQWTGLARYLDDRIPNEHDEWENVEYGKSSVLADCKMINFRFYWDIPGKVPDSMVESNFLGDPLYADDINGSKPPAYGLDFGVHGGTIVYGPWADRQRIGLQHIFVPLSFVDSVPASKLKPGDTRVSTVFKIYVSIEEDVTLRIPTKEPSKDERWQGRSARYTKPPDAEGDVKKRHARRGTKEKHNKWRKGKQTAPAMDSRPYGWIDVIVKKDTTVNYNMDMFARQDGFKNSLDMDVKGTEMTSSVNHGLLWRAGRLTLNADLSNPKEWKVLRKWPFKIVCDDLELFILRDHMFLIIDLVNDWSSGPLPAFFTFVPYIYKLDMMFRNFVLYLNVNDANIINDPADIDKNDFLTLEGTSLHGVLGISLEHYRPKRSWLDFDVLAHDMKMRMLSPSRSTFNSFFPDKQVAFLPKLTLQGSYSANAEAGPTFTDTLRFDITGTGLTLKAYGYMVRQLINLKENYFGDFVHFRTLEEFQGENQEEIEAREALANTPKPQSTSELDVILCIIVEDATVLIPTNLYVGKEFVKAELPRADLDLRVSSYYLDMGLNLSPVSILSESFDSSKGESPSRSASSTQIYVSHCDLSGHRAFGLPPSEPAYVSTWDIDIGSITGECSSAFARDLALAAQAFIFAFQDGENSLPVTSPIIINDIAFVHVQTDILRLWLHVGKDAMLVSAHPVTVNVNDWATKPFSQRISVLAPLITFACVDGRSASRHRVRRGRKIPVRTHAFFQTGVVVNVVGRKSHFEDERIKQQAHVRQNDLRTARAPFLQHRRSERDAGVDDEIEYDAPAMTYPGLPFPLDRSGRVLRRPSSIKSVKSVLSDRLLKSQPSRSSLASSIRGQETQTCGAMFQSIGPRPGGNPRSLSESLRRASQQSSSSSLPSLVGGMPGDIERTKFGLPPSTMAFASPYAEPYFPLDVVEPDESNVPPFPDTLNAGSGRSDASSSIDEIRELEPETDAEYTGVFISLEPGIRAYIEPRMAAVAAKLFRKILPKSSEDVMDAFQMQVLKSITNHQQARHGDSSILEIQASLPAAHIRVVNPASNGSPLDQVDATLRSLEQMVRIGTQPSELGADETFALRTAAESINLTLSDQESGSGSTPAVDLDIDDVLVWVAAATKKSAHIAVRHANLVASGEQAPYFARLALRILPIVQEMEARFKEPLDADRRRLLLLIHTLTKYSDGVSDPPFLSRMNYILRAFPDHFRNQESWKVLSRFRHIMNQLPVDVREHLIEQSKSATFDCPTDAPAKILQSWAQWRNWDVPNIGQTLAFKTIFGHGETENLDADDERPTSLTTAFEDLSIAVTNGDKTSQVAIEGASLKLESKPPKLPTGLRLIEENKRIATVMQLHTESISISLDWSLYSIAENIVPLIDQFQAPTAPETKQGHRKVSRVFEEGLQRHDFHVVFSTESGKMSLRSVNLLHISHADRIKLSVVGSTNLNEEYAQCATALLNADSAVTELHGTSSCIWRTLLTSPSIYVDHLQPPPGNDAPPTVSLAAAYNDLEISIKDQIPGILHTIDSIILDEVAQVIRLIQMVDSSQSPPKVLTNEAPAPILKKPLKMSIAMLAGDLHLDVSLLSTLNYQLEGKAASLRIAPNLTENKLFDIDFHVGRQSHSFVNLSEKERHTQGILELPPINGHVGLRLQSGKDEMSISVSTTIERVDVDAAAIQSVITVVNRPEVQSIISAIKGGVEDIQHHVADLDTGRPETLKEKAQSYQKIAFDVRFALLGIRIAATTPQIKGKSTAQVEVGIGLLHAKASNRNNTASLIPDVRAQVQDIGARLWINNRGKHQSCGNVSLGLRVQFDSQMQSHGRIARELKVESDILEVNAYPDTASTAVDVINHLQDRIRDLDLSKEVEYLRRLRDSRRQTVMQSIKKRRQSAIGTEEDAFSATELLSSLTTTVALNNIQICWHTGQAFAPSPTKTPDDLVLTLESIVFNTRGGNEARLTIQDLMLQLTGEKPAAKKRSLNSALLPEVGFSVAYWSTGTNRSLAFKASGLPLDLRLESRFLIPVNSVKRSVTYAIDAFKTGTATWQSTPTATGAPRKVIFDTKQLASLLVEADFAGAQVYMQGTGLASPSLSAVAAASQASGAQHGRYGQFAADGKLMQTTLKAPGIALKVEYNSNDRQPTVNGEMLIDASNNMLLPNVVPLVLEVSNSIKEVVQSQEDEEAKREDRVKENKISQKLLNEESIASTSPSALFGKTKVDLGLRIRRQEFGLSCQPIARVDAKAALDDFYFTINTIDSADEYGHFFAMSAVVTKLTAQVKHVYSREPTFSYDMDSIALSLMNSKHLSGVSGISAILKLNPTRIVINGKQLQDLLLFREIWHPPEIRNARAAPPPPTSNRPEDFMMHRYQIVAAAAAFPWNATISIAELAVDLDLGQSIGKSSFSIVNMWASQQKSSDWEQSLCIGLDEMAVNSTGRMSGFIQLAKLGIRTSIKWPQEKLSEKQTPLIQASIGFDKLRAKAAFDYQAFAFADIEGFDFLMYNVRETSPGAKNQDRLVAVLDCDKAYVFCTSTSPAQALGLYQAFDRLILEKQAAFTQSLKDIEKHLRRESTVVPTRFGPQVPNTPAKVNSEDRSPISLHTDVVVTLGAISFGVFPSTFFDSQILKLEANNIQARFAVGLVDGKIHSGLGMTLGQLQVALASVRRMTVVPKALDISVDDIVSSARNAKGGTILRVPKVVASMQTWQVARDNHVDYIFKSLFDGKIDVGWNLSRINFIKNMWVAHSRSLASRLGKALPESAVKITAGLDESKKDQNDDAQTTASEAQQDKITAEVHLPQSRYEYRALEPPIIETPQLRDMGEATPPLEWIGLNRDRLPNVTHQILIVSLLEVAKEVEDAYEKILGSSSGSI